MPRMNWNMPAMATQWQADTMGAGQASGAEENDYWTRARRFNPSEAINTYARGAASEANQYLTTALGDLKGQAVGAGRLNTGFFDTDSGRVVRDVYADLNSRIAQQATAGAGMDLQNISTMGQMADASRNRYVDMLAAGMDRGQAEINDRRRRRSALLAGLGAVAGGILGSAFKGIGTAAGASMGASFGGGLGG